MNNKDIFVTYFTEPEEKALLQTIKLRFADIKAERDYYWIQVLRHTAIRIAVMANLTVGEAERIVRSERFVINGAHNKRKKEREFYCKKVVVTALKNLLRIHRKMTVGSEWEDICRLDSPLVLSRNHRGMSIRNYQDRMKFWCIEAKLPFKASPHWWRHTWAKRQLADYDGDPALLLKVMTYLQHENLKTTQIYLKPDKEEMDLFSRHSR